MPKRIAAASVAAVLLLGPTLARANDPPITNREPDALDVAKTPMTDLNLSRTEIPALLVEAQQRPYALHNLGNCAQIAAAVEEFDGILGPDVDLPQGERARLSEGRIAQWAVARLIPFRSIIREISGANKQERLIAAAIQAGIARRSFLKGVGAARGCAYPASAATETVIAQHAAAETKADEKAKAARIEAESAVVNEPPRQPAESPPPVSKPPTVFASEPVIQPTH